MRPLSLLFVALSLVSPTSFAQELTPTPGDQPQALQPMKLDVMVDQTLVGDVERDLQSYVIKLTEFRFKNAPARTLTSQDVVEQFSATNSSDHIEQVQEISLSALQGYESMTRLGKQSAVTSSISGVRGGRMPMPEGGGPGGRPDFGQPGMVRSTQTMQVGTVLRVTARPQSGKVFVDLQYEASRFDDEIPIDSPPDIHNLQFKSTFLLEPGKPKLLSGIVSKDNTYLVIVVEK